MNKPLKITIDLNYAYTPVGPIKRKMFWLNIGLNIGKGCEIRRDYFNVTDLYTSKAQCRYNNFKRIRTWIKHYLCE